MSVLAQLYGEAKGIEKSLDTMNKSLKQLQAQDKKSNQQEQKFRQEILKYKRRERADAQRNQDHIAETMDKAIGKKAGQNMMGGGLLTALAAALGVAVAASLGGKGLLGGKDDKEETPTSTPAPSPPAGGATTTPETDTSKLPTEGIKTTPMPSGGGLPTIKSPTKKAFTGIDILNDIVEPIEQTTTFDKTKELDVLKRIKDLYKKETEGVEAKQSGGFTGLVPSLGQPTTGDHFYTSVAPGSYIMNRNLVDAMGYQSGGVPVALEAGEIALPPGSYDKGMMDYLNYTAFPRFQEGGAVSQNNAGGARGGSVSEGETGNVPVDGSGVQAVLKAAEASIGLSQGISEQCANTTREVLRRAGHPAADKTTSQGDLDPEGTKFNGKAFAASFAGSDMGSVTSDLSSVKPGNIMLWRDTYGNFAPGAITHVGIAGEGDTQYDHGSSQGWRKRSRQSLASKFAYGIDLNGQATGKPGDGGPTKSGKEGASGAAGGGATGFAQFGEFGKAASDVMNKIIESMPPGLRGIFGDEFGGGDTKKGQGGQELGATTVRGGATESAGKYKNLLDLIASKESGAAGYNAYNEGGHSGGHGVSGYSGHSAKGPVGKNLTEMSIAQIMKHQKDLDPPIHAAGRYQIIGPTMRGLMSGAYGSTGVNPDDIFSPEVQDKLAIALIKGRMKSGATAKNFGQEWIGLQNIDQEQLQKAINNAKQRGGAVKYMKGGSVLAENLQELNENFKMQQMSNMDPIVIYDDEQPGNVMATRSGGADNNDPFFLPTRSTSWASAIMEYRERTFNQGY